MADLRINELPPAPGALDPSDQILCSSANGDVGVSYRRPASELAAFFEPPDVPGGSGLGDGVWELHQTWNHSVDGNAFTSLNFTNLGGASDIRIVILGVTKTAAAEFTLEMSQDNGATWFTTSGDYVSFSTAAASNRANIPIAGGSATAARTNATMIEGLESYPSVNTPALNTGQPSAMFVANANPVNAVRLLFGAGALNGGVVRVFKRRRPRYRLPVYTVAELDALSALDGDTVLVSDADTPVRGDIVTGGGSVRCQVNYDGTNWRVN